MKKNNKNSERQEQRDDSLGPRAIVSLHTKRN